MVERMNKEKPILEDFITILDASDGAIMREVSLLSCFEDSIYASFLDLRQPWGDIFHTNTVELLDGRFAERSPIFKAGNVLVSVRELNVIAIVDLDAEAVVWALSGMWCRQHHPTMLDNGNMLLFDNLGHGGRSKVIEFEPLTQTVVWSYGTTPSEDFFSQTGSTCERLPNGNTVITESDNGRAFEVTPDGEIVWEFINTHRAGSQRELVATLNELIRIPPSFPLDWVKSPTAQVAASLAPNSRTN